MSLQVGDTVRAPNIDHDLTVTEADAMRAKCMPASAQPACFLPSGQFFSGDEPLQHMLWALKLITSSTGAGLFTTAHGVNSGSGAIDAGAVTNGNLWIPDTYTVTFTSSSAWKVTNSKGAQIASGAYANPTTLSFLGVQLTISGAPASGDTFTLTPAAGAAL